MGDWIAPLLTGLGALGGLARGSKAPTTTTTPIYDNNTQNFRDMLMQQYSARINGSPAYDKAYRIAGLNNIEDTGKNEMNSIGNLLTSRGLGRTTGGVSGLTGLLYNLGRQTADFKNHSILDLDQRNAQNLQAAGGFLQSLPYGQKTVGTNPNSAFGNMLGGATEGLGTWLGQKSAQNNYADLLKQYSQASGGYSGRGGFR